MNRREIIAGAAALAACGPAESEAQAAPFPMRRGVNLGNALEAPNEGEWGYRIEAAHLAAIADAGFDGVRLPVRWDAHAAAAAPYAIAPTFFARVDEVVGQALERGLIVQLDLHHFDALIAERPGERERYLGIWRQIAEHYRDAPAGLIFEPLNEPHGDRWRGARLTTLQRDVVAIIRENNPTRLIVLGPGNWQNIDALRDWRPPEGENIAVSVHYYEPHAFTHQNAEWLGADAPRFDRFWGGFDDRATIHHHLDEARRWGATNGYALQLGEFGVIRNAPMDQRGIWLRFVRGRSEEFGLGWCVWDFAGAFAIWDRENGRFHPDALAALGLNA